MKQGEICQEDLINCENGLDQLKRMIAAKTKELREAAAKLAAVNKKLDEKQEQLTKAQKDLTAAQTKKPKPFGLSVFVGVDYRGDPTAGAGVSYSPLRF